MNNILFYSAPARNFEEVLPPGNGSTGMMVYGRTDKEIISLNEDTLRSGMPNCYEDSYAASALPKAWEYGMIKGICARGNITVDITWEQGELKDAVLYTPGTETVFADVKYKNTIRRVEIKPGNKVILKEEIICEK